MTATNAITAANYGYILVCPDYSPFLRLDTIINSQTTESISQWNQICKLWINCNISVADKAGLQASFGYNETAADNEHYFHLMEDT